MEALIVESRRSRLSSGTLRILMACAVAGLALLLSWPAAAQTVICDSDFATGNWLLQTFSCPAGNSVMVSQRPIGGSTSTGLANPQPPTTPASCALNNNYRDVSDILNIQGNGSGVCPGESTVYGVHIFNGINPSYDPASSGAIASIDFQIDFECPDSVTSAPCTPNGQAFGPALMQGGRYFIANAPGTVTGVTGTPPVWKRSSTSSLQVGAFNEITPAGSGIIIDSNSHPDFDATGKSIQCGFYTGNGTLGGIYTIQAGYDNWVCTITPAQGVLKVCKVAGPGITVGMPFNFTANGVALSVPVPAGPGPGGNCVVGKTYPIGTTVNIVETPTTGVAVSNIAVAVAPPGSVVSTNNANGTVSVVIGSGVTEVTYTDVKTTGYLEVCKTGIAGGSFTVNGTLGPFAVSPGTCSPAIQVTAGPQVTITEAPVSGTAISGCTTYPAGRLVSCPPITPNVVVTVVPGDVPTETIVTINNARTRNPGSPAQ